MSNMTISQSERVILLAAVDNMIDFARESLSNVNGRHRPDIQEAISTLEGIKAKVENAESDFSLHELDKLSLSVYEFKEFCSQALNDPICPVALRNESSDYFKQANRLLAKMKNYFRSEFPPDVVRRFEVFRID
ncbi:MAG TPA: hypothetical protein PKB13_10135 [Clostridia bacterium]|nr:hypothetical protein [Clostridia bacterium]